MDHSEAFPGQLVVYESDPMLYGPMQIREITHSGTIAMCHVDGVYENQAFSVHELMSADTWAKLPA